MANIIEGNLNAAGLKFGIVISRFNEFLTNRLLGGAIDSLTRHGAAESEIDVAWVPGAMEIPVVAKKMASGKRYNAIICLAVVIRGGTPHFEHVCNSLTRGVGTIALESGLPVIYGAITADSIEQAIERAGTKAGNKGFDAACAAIEMANLLRNIAG
jgi:6,7-dimethyl-8-ribityllumazine synthase